METEGLFYFSYLDGPSTLTALSISPETVGVWVTSRVSGHRLDGVDVNSERYSGSLVTTVLLGSSATEGRGSGPGTPTSYQTRKSTKRLVTGTC